MISPVLDDVELDVTAYVPRMVRAARPLLEALGLLRPAGGWSW